MSMYNYIYVGAKKYATKITWEPSVIKPSTIRATQAGGLDATYGPARYKVWEGEIKARVTPASGYGTPAELEASLSTMGAISFTDHTGTGMSVHVQEWKRVSVHPQWEASSNTFYYNVRLQGV